jgi:proteasome accessory factor B
MSRLTQRRLETLKTLADATGRRRAVTITTRQAGLSRGPFTASVLGFKPEAGRWLIAALLHDLGSVRVLDLARISGASPARSRPRPSPTAFDAAAFSGGAYLGWGATAQRVFSLRSEAGDLTWLKALLPGGKADMDLLGNAVVKLSAAHEELVLSLALSLGTPVAVDSDPPMPAPRASPKDDPGSVRCLRLAQWLLTQDEPASRGRIYAAFPKEYSGNAAGKEKKFGRDKALLRDLGFALETVELGGREDATGYVLDARSTILPMVEFTPDEAALLWFAGTGALRLSDHPLRDELENALRKLAVGVKGLPPRAAATEELSAVTDVDSTEQRSNFELLIKGWKTRKTLTIDYWRVGTGGVVQRQVDVYGWALRRGEWILVGYCHLRKAVRIFYLSRCRKLKKNAVRTQDPDYEIPVDFDIRRWSRQQVWDYDVHAPKPAVVRFRGSLARVAKQLLPEAKLTTEPSGARIARLEVRNLRGLVRQALAWGLEAELVEPAEGRAMAREILERVAGTEAGVAP